MYSGHSYYSLYRPMPFHGFPDIICEDDDTKSLNQEFGNCRDNILYHDIAHCKWDRSRYLHFPEIICEDDSWPKARSLTDEFVNKQGNNIQYFENNEQNSKLDFLKVNLGNDFRCFPEVICEDDAKPILMETLCNQTISVCDKPTENINSEILKGSKVAPSSRYSNNSLNSNEQIFITCEYDLCESGSIKMKSEEVNSEKKEIYENMKHNVEEGNFCHNDQDDELQDSILLSLAELEEAVFTKETHKLKMPCTFANDASDLLSAHADLLNMDDPWKKLQQAVSFGRTIQLTEAGLQALLMITPDPIILPFQNRNDEVKENESNKFLKNAKSCFYTSQITSNRVKDNGINTCNAVMLRTELTDKNLYRGKDAIIGDTEPNMCFEDSSAKMDCDTTFLELDKNLQILSNHYKDNHLNDLLRKQLVSGPLLYNEITDIYKNIDCDNED